MTAWHFYDTCQEKDVEEAQRKRIRESDRE